MYNHRLDYSVEVQKDHGYILDIAWPLAARMWVRVRNQVIVGPFLNFIYVLLVVCDLLIWHFTFSRHLI